MKYEKATAQQIIYENSDVIRASDGANSCDTAILSLVVDYASNWGNPDYECVSKANEETHVYCVSTMSSGHGM